MEKWSDEKKINSKVLQQIWKKCDYKDNDNNLEDIYINDLFNTKQHLYIKKSHELNKYIHIDRYNCITLQYYVDIMKKIHIFLEKINNTEQQAEINDGRCSSQYICDPPLDHKQSQIFNTDSPIITLEGGPGTGKTQTSSERIKNWALNGGKILILSTTGKAIENIKKRIENIKKKIPDKSVRIKLSKNIEFNTIAKYLCSKSKETIDRLVLEESSMIDLISMFSIIKKLDNMDIKSLLVIGDLEQLPPINGFSCILHEVKKLDYVYHIELETIHRSEGKNIPKLLKKINNSDIFLELLTKERMCKGYTNIKQYNGYKNKNKEIYYNGDNDNVDKHILKAILKKKNIKKKGSNIFKKIMIICNKNDTRYKLNTFIQNIVIDNNNKIKFKHKLKRFLENNNEFYKGDRIIIRKNIYVELENEEKELIACNGSLGYINDICIKDKTIYYIVKLDNDRTIKINKKIDNINIDKYKIIYGIKDENDKDNYDCISFSDCKMELGYTITVHCAQGSENDEVIFIYKPQKDPKRNLIYTGISRAKKTITVLCDERYLIKALNNKHMYIDTHFLDFSSSENNFNYAYRED